MEKKGLDCKELLIITNLFGLANLEQKQQLSNILEKEIISEIASSLNKTNI